MLVGRRLRELGKPVDWAYEMVAAALVGGLIGARGYWLIQNHESLQPRRRARRQRADLVRRPGWAAWLPCCSGRAGAASSRSRSSTWRVPGLALGYAIGRIGCQVSGDGDYGRAWDGPWAMGYPHGTVPTAPGVTVHPTPIYETLVMGLVAYVLWQLRDRVRPGVLFALYLVIAGAERFLIEFIRRNETVALGLTAAQLESLSLFIVGAVWLTVVGRRGGLMRDDVPGRRRRATVPAT